MDMKSTSQAMETEKIPRLLAQLAIPAVVAQIINLLYNIVDRIYIGHISGVGAAALTGVGLFTPILMLINAFAMLAGSGGAPRAAISMGKKDNKTAEKILGNCFALLILMAVILTVVFFTFAPQLLTLFGASEKTLPYGVAYARIYILGSIFVLIVIGMKPFITTSTSYIPLSRRLYVLHSGTLSGRLISAPARRFKSSTAMAARNISSAPGR